MFAAVTLKDHLVDQLSKRGKFVVRLCVLVHNT